MEWQKIKTFIKDKHIVSRLINSALFYFGWLAAMHGAAQGLPHIGVLIIVCILCLHLFFSKCKKADILAICTLSIIGTALDSCYCLLKIMKFAEGYAKAPWLAPYWITALWALYASALNHSLAWLKPFPFLALALGSIGGPATYLPASELGAVFFEKTFWQVLTLLAAIWALLLPATIYYASWLQKICGEKSD